MVRIVAYTLQQPDSRLRHSLDKPVEVPMRIEDGIFHSVDDMRNAWYRFIADGCHIGIELQQLVGHHPQRLRARRVSIGEIGQCVRNRIGMMCLAHHSFAKIVGKAIQEVL